MANNPITMRLWTHEETEQYFQADPVYQAIKRSGTGIEPILLEIRFLGESAASFTEIGSAATNTFDGSMREIGGIEGGDV